MTTVKNHMHLNNNAECNHKDCQWDIQNYSICNHNKTKTDLLKLTKLINFLFLKTVSTITDDDVNNDMENKLQQWK